MYQQRLQFFRRQELLFNKALQLSHRELSEKGKQSPRSLVSKPNQAEKAQLCTNRDMFDRLKRKWKVESNLQLFLILCTFAVTGTTTAWISREITSWVGFDEGTFWLWKTLLRLFILVFGYQAVILAVSVFFGQFRFFWNYEKKILAWMGLIRKPEATPKSAEA